MDQDFMLICLLPLLLYYMVSFIIYFTEARNKELFQMVIFPLPIVIIVLLFYFGSIGLDNENDYNMIVIFLIAVSVMAGTFILYHCFLEHKKRDWLFFGRVLISIILILSPLLLYSADYVSSMMLLYLICGASLGIYGFNLYYTDKKIGLLYVYTSLIFMVIIPALSITVAKFYLDNFEPELIYRRANNNWVTCHLPATPIVPGPEGFQPSIFLSSLYVLLFGFLSSERKKKLQKKLKKEGVIPDEFYQIINQEEDK